MSTSSALDRLRSAADAVRAGWMPTQWRVTGDATRTLEMRPRQLQEQPYGVFPELVLEPGTTVALECDLDVPAAVCDVQVVGDPLELTVNSLYPITVRTDDDLVLDAGGVPAAAGPALIDVVAALSPECSPVLRLEIRTPLNQVPSIASHLVPPWVWLHFTTPSLRARFEALDLAWARLHLAETVAETEAERAAVARATAAVPADPLTATQDQLDTIATLLEPVAARIAAMRVHLVGHSHIDLAWLWTWEDTVEVVERDFTSVLSLMGEFPEMSFTHSQPATYEVIRERQPKLLDAVREHVAAGRWEPATSQWVESDTHLVAGESLARQHLEGVTWTREHLDVTPEVFLAPDTFGHTGNLPQLAASAGARFYYHHRCIPQGDLPAYWWEGDDGTRLLGVTTRTYYGHITAGAAARAASRAHKAGHRTALQFYGVCDHGGGPTRQSLEARRRLDGLAGLPSLECSTIRAYADELLAEDPPLPVHGGESSLTFPGCYTSHCDTKSMNRRAEALLSAADSLSVLAGLDAGPPTEAWRDVLFQQFHDILGGSSIADVYVDQAATMDVVEKVAAAVVTEAVDALHATVDDLGSIAVTNPLGCDRLDAVFVDGVVPPEGDNLVAVGADGHVTSAQRTDQGVCFVARVPSFGSVTYRLEASAGNATTPPTVETSGELISVTTDRLAAVIDRASGALTSLVDRSTGIDALAGDGSALNVVEVVEEAPIGMSAWNVGKTNDERPLRSGAETTVLEEGPVRVVVGVKQQFGSSTLEQRMTFWTGLDRVDVTMVLDWHERPTEEGAIPGLKVGLIVDVPDPVAWYETPFAAATRPLGPAEVPALGWGAVEGSNGRGLAIVTDARHGYDSDGKRLRVRLVRSPYEPDPVADVGRHEVSLSYVPLREGWRNASLPQRAAGLLTPLLAAAGKTAAPVAANAWRPEIHADDTTVVSALKRARHKDAYVLRLYDAGGRGGHARIGGLPDDARVCEATITEDISADLAPVDGAVDIDLKPFQVVSLVVGTSSMEP